MVKVHAKGMRKAVASLKVVLIIIPFALLVKGKNLMQFHVIPGKITFACIIYCCKVKSYLMQDLILWLDSLTRVAIGPSVIANKILVLYT